MGQLNRLLNCVVSVMASCLGTHSTYVKRSDLPWSLGYGSEDPAGGVRSWCG
jgi:hypothetical protein